MLSPSIRNLVIEGVSFSTKVCVGRRHETTKERVRFRQFGYRFFHSPCTALDPQPMIDKKVDDEDNSFASRPMNVRLFIVFPV